MITVYRSHFTRFQNSMSFIKDDTEYRYRINEFVNTIELEECKNFLLIGKVQSGKTLTYTGLLAALFDRGFSMGVVLSGTKLNLQNQTLVRLRKDLSKHGIIVLSDKEKELNEKVEDALNSGKCVVIVCLKHTTRLNDLQSKLSSYPDIVKVLIDDESDQASLNNYNFSNSLNFQTNSSATFGAVKSFLELDKIKFIQVTATPAAHFLTDYLDLFKPDYFALIPPHSNYLGNDYFFNQDNEGVVSIIENKTEISEFDLQHFCLAYFSACINLIRSDVENISAFIHGDSTIQVNNNYYQKITEIFESIKNDVSYVNGLIDCEEKRFVLSHIDILKSVVRQVVIIRVFDKYDKNIDWQKFYDENRFFMLIGGGKLERGFTIEGLTTTYMPRVSKSKANSDTIQQRARFFGSRRHLSKYCKVFMTEKLKEEFIEYKENEDFLFETFSGVNPGSLTENIFSFEITNPCRKSVISSLRENIRNKWKHVYVYQDSYQIDNLISDSEFLGYHIDSGDTENRTHMLMKIGKLKLATYLSSKNLYRPFGYFGISEDFTSNNFTNLRYLLRLFENEDLIEFVKLGGDFTTVRTYTSKLLKNYEVLIPKAVHSGRSRNGDYCGDHKIFHPSGYSQTTLHIQKVNLDSRDNQIYVLSFNYG